MENDEPEQRSPSHSEPGTDTETDGPPKGDSPSETPQPQNEVPRQRRATRRGAAVRDRQADQGGVDPAIFDNVDTADKQVANANRGGQQMANQQTGPVGRRQRGGGNEGKEPLRLRLDINLDLDVELRARIHGDVTLALL